VFTFPNITLLERKTAATINAQVSAHNCRRKIKKELTSVQVHHIGFAVKDILQALSPFEQLGFHKTGQIIKDSTRKVALCFLENDNYTIELVAPLEKGSPVDYYLKRGGTPYHLCYETENLTKTLAKLKIDGFVELQESAPAPAIGNQNVAFMFHPRLGLIELLERGKDHTSDE
jgi:methylmalonyl-CoA/ethylmalonyl-CoA epimerase